MRKIILLVLTVFVLVACNEKKGLLIESASTIEISDTDSKDSIIIKAAHVVPTPNQYEALKNEFIAFIHFGPNTFTRVEWGNGMEDPKIFDLKNLDTDQWCKAMKSAGMKMVIITVKHHDGFVLWQSRYTKHGIMWSPFQDGKGDTLKELTKTLKSVKSAGRPLLIKSDRRASVGRIVDVWDLCRKLGIERINIATNQAN